MAGNPSPAVTVLIPTFNRAHYLAECLDSILCQTLPPAQVLVVNDGSTDATLKVLEPYRGRIDYLETDQMGKPAAINRGLERVIGHYLWIFDDDDVALPDALERFVRPLEDHPEHGFSYSTYFFTVSRPRGHRIGRVLYESDIPDVRSRGFLIPLLESNTLGGAALFARTSCYQTVGPFDPALVRSQDYEMAVRIARRFSGIRVSGGATFHYRQHQGMRGTFRDRFIAEHQKMKWLEYDQVIFRRLYREIPLKEYLPPGAMPEGWRRQALLQRFAVMGKKLLIPEALEDLDEIARLPEQGPLTGGEKQIVQILVKSPYYGFGNVLNRRELLKKLKRLSGDSRTVLLLKREIVSASLKQCRERPDPRRILSTLRRIFFLA